MYLSIYLSTSLQSIGLSLVYMFNYPSFYLHAYPPVCLPAHLFMYLLSAYLPTYLTESGFARETKARIMSLIPCILPLITLKSCFPFLLLLSQLQTTCPLSSLRIPSPTFFPLLLPFPISSFPTHSFLSYPPTPPFGLSSLPSSHVPRLTKLLSSFSYLSLSPSCPPFSLPPLSNLIPSSFSLLSNSLPTSSYLVLRLPLSPLAPPLIPLLSFRPLVYLSTKYSPVALPFTHLLLVLTQIH